MSAVKIMSQIFIKHIFKSWEVRKLNKLKISLKPHEMHNQKNLFDNVPMNLSFHYMYIVHCSFHVRGIQQTLVQQTWQRQPSTNNRRNKLTVQTPMQTVKTSSSTWAHFHGSAEFCAYKHHSLLTCKRHISALQAQNAYMEFTHTLSQNSPITTHEIWLM